MMKKKMLIAGIVNLAAAVLTVLCLLFILLDISAFKLFENNVEGLEGLGIAVIFALSIAIEYPATAVNFIFQGISGGVQLAYPKRGKGVHKALRVIAWIVGVAAAAVHAYFAVLYFSAEFVLWGVLIALTSLATIAAPLLTSIAHNGYESIDD